MGQVVPRSVVTVLARQRVWADLPGGFPRRHLPRRRRRRDRQGTPAGVKGPAARRLAGARQEPVPSRSA